MLPERYRYLSPAATIVQISAYCAGAVTNLSAG